ncbi:MAG: hypothetical protein K1X86_06120 [Ignavibacteria bacterium]|nr:hypothetical protein [Ignavibacteria bacterium]
MKKNADETKISFEERLKSFEDVQVRTGERNPEALDEFILLLEDNYVNSDEAFKYVLKRRISKLISIIIGVILNIIGFALILIPMPTEFDDVVILRATPQNGLHLSDVFGFAEIIGVVVVFIGTLLIFYGAKRYKS